MILKSLFGEPGAGRLASRVREEAVTRNLAVDFHRKDPVHLYVRLVLLRN